MEQGDFTAGLSPDEIDAIARTAHADPHHVLGAHAAPHGGVVLRAFRPDARALRALPDDPKHPAVALTRIHPAGVWAGLLPRATVPLRYRLELEDNHGTTRTFRDPYALAPTLGALDLHLVAEGRHRRLYDRLGAHATEFDGVAGVAFAVWAPNARRVSVVGDFNYWDGRYHPMRRFGATGVWELFVPDVHAGAKYKFEVVTAAGEVTLKLDPFARQTELRPATAGIVAAPAAHRWRDGEYLAKRAARDPLRSPMSIYEVHLGSWMRVPEEHDRWLTYRELAEKLGAYCADLGFTHVELMPVAEHPFDGSWGYQVTGYFAPTARHGTPDDFRYFVDAMHARGIGVLLDWVPAHFPRDTFALARFDGTALYEHADPRQGEHPDWGTLVFNYSRHEVRNFLLANALYWLDEFHIDGLRVDAVASMLYLDYSRKAGEWVPNEHGGRENLGAIAFLRELNEVVHGQFPGAIVIAEESTAWPAVSKPTYVGGLGFTLKWNMGWMHDTLAYFSMDSIHRKHHHHQLTFGLWYAFSENFVLPLSHDEVVHLKGSLLQKMPGDEWQRFANLRALLAYMWCHPGKKLLFMGGEFGQRAEWSHERSLDWHLLEQPAHAGVQTLLRDLNNLYRAHDAFWEADIDPAGFQWSVVADSDQSVAAFVRYNRDRSRHVVCALNATPVPRPSYRLGVPAPGEYREALNTDAAVYGGSNSGNHGAVMSQAEPSHGFSHSIVITLPPLAAVVFVGPPGPAAADEEAVPSAEEEPAALAAAG